MPTSGRRRFRAVALVTALLVCRGSAAGLPWVGTYLGGSGEDRIVGVGIDEAGNVHVIGRTRSADFPTVPLLPPAPSPAGLAFVSRFDPTGANLLSSVVLEGFTADVSAAAVDASGNVVITGHTRFGLPVVNATQPAHGGERDAFVAKIAPSGAIAFSTYLGGGGFDVGSDVAVDAAGRIHVVGLTTSGLDGTTPFPVKDAWQPRPRGVEDVFVARLGPAGGLEWATYLGGEHWERWPSVATDASGGTWVAVETHSGGYPTTPGAWQPVARPGPLLSSDDGGDTWTPGGETLRDGDVTAIAVDPSDPAIVYVGTGTGGIHRSDDRGRTWTLLHRTASADVAVFSLAVDGGLPATIYAGIEVHRRTRPHGPAGGTVLRSRDGGVTWKDAGIGLFAQSAPALVIDPEDARTVYAVIGTPFGLHRTENGADSWTPIPLPPGLPGEFRVPFTGTHALDEYPRGRLAIDPNDGDHLIVAGHQRVAESFDRGLTWTVAAEVFGGCHPPTCQICGSVCSDVRAVAIDPSDSSTVYLAGTMGLAKTTDGGRSWDHAAGCISDVAGLVVDPTSPSTLWAIGSVAPGRRDLVRSVDGGVTWEQVGEPPSRSRYNVLAFAPGAPARLHAGLTRWDSQTAVTRLDAAGAPVYSTYAGAVGEVLDVDSAGNAFLPTLSLDPDGMPRAFPVPSALKPKDVVSLAVDAEGRVHLYARTGPSGTEFHTSIDPASPAAGLCVPLPDYTYGDIGVSQLAVTPAGDAIVAIVAGASGLATPGAYQETYAGDGDAFVARLLPNDDVPLDLCLGPPPTSTTSLPRVSCTFSPTTTTLPPSCGGGAYGAACLLRGFLAEPLCAGEPAGSRLRRLVERKGTRALELLAKATVQEGRQRARAIRRADRLLRAIQRRAENAGRKGGISKSCGAHVRTVLTAVRDALATG